MDGVTTFLQTSPWTTQLMKQWARMKIWAKEKNPGRQVAQAWRGRTTPQEFWHKDTWRQRKTTVLDRVTREEQENFHREAAAQGSQAAWRTRLEVAEQ